MGDRLALTELRRQLHRSPELGFAERATRDAVRAALMDFGAPTSIAFEIVGREAPGWNDPVFKYWGNTSFAFDAARKPRQGMPARLAMRPAHRLPRLPDGTTKRAGAPASRIHACR